MASIAIASSSALAKQGGVEINETKFHCTLDGKKIQFQRASNKGSTLIEREVAQLGPDSRLVFDYSPYYDFESQIKFESPNVSFTVLKKMAAQNESSDLYGGFIFRGSSVVCRIN